MRYSLRMSLYAFILGRKYLLSTAELCQVLPSDAHIVDILPDALIADLKQPLQNPQESLNRLGGTIKIVEIFAEQSIDPAKLAPAISEYLSQKFMGKEQKLNYGVSLYSFSNKSKELLKKILIQIKKNLKTFEIKSRFINNDFKNPENAAIHHEKLLEEGAEIVAIQGHHKMFVGRTVALQDFESYSQRDYDRPGRDAKLGMLPPKLAQIMINLAGLTHLEETTHPHTVIYDPFCGTGTVLTEALIMGLSALGSDKDEVVLEKSNQNITFILSHINYYQQNHRLFAKDATMLTTQDFPEKIAAVVTESYLGPALSQFPPPELIKKNHHYLQELLTRFFEAIDKILLPGTPIIITFPIYRQNNRMIFMEEISEHIQKIGFKAAPLIPTEISQKFTLPVTPRPSLIYDRPDQIVGREVWKFIKH